jgi:hypothetical protein
MKRQRIAAILALAVGALGASAQAQVYQKSNLAYPGQALDRSPQVGSGGYNANTGLGTYGTYALDSRLYVTGQVSGLAGFRGGIPYTPMEQFQGALPTASLSTFRGQSVGVTDVLAGRTLAPTAYFDPARTILKAPAIVSGLAGPGTRAPANPADASVGAAINARLYVDAMAEYRSLLPTSPGKALAVPMTAGGAGAYVPAGAGGAAAERPPMWASRTEEEAVPGRGMLLDVLGQKERAILGREFYNLERANRPLDTSLRLAVEARVRGEPNYAPPTDPNHWRSTETVLRLGGEANVRVLMHRPNVDVYIDILQTHRLRREAGMGGSGIPAESNAPVLGAAVPTAGRIVELLTGGKIILHRLAGYGKDLVNRNLAEGERLLKAGKYYEAAEAFAVAATLGPGNPLPRVGRGLALFGAGEPLSAAREFQAAMVAFPVLMEVTLDAPGIMDAKAFQSRLEELDARLAQPEEGRDVLLPFLACFLHQVQGQEAQARTFAQEVQAGSEASKVVQAYAEFVLTGKRPTRQPATAPATQPADESAAALSR